MTLALFSCGHTEYYVPSMSVLYFLFHELVCSDVVVSATDTCTVQFLGWFFIVLPAKTCFCQTRGLNQFKLLKMVKKQNAGITG